MKSRLMIISILAIVCMATSSCYNRLGKLTMISTRNVDSKTEYVLIAKDVIGKAKVKNKQALESAVDDAVKQYPTGEFMKNVIVEVKTSGKKVRVTGDVWGMPVK